MEEWDSLNEEKNDSLSKGSTVRCDIKVVHRSNVTGRTWCTSSARTGSHEACKSRGMDRLFLESIWSRRGHEIVQSINVRTDFNSNAGDMDAKEASYKKGASKV
jgi:hypothetical protein